MKIKLVKMDNSISEFTEKGNYDLFVAHNLVIEMLQSKIYLRKFEKLELLSAKKLLTVGYSEQLGYDFLYQVVGGYIHVLVRKSGITFVYISVSGTTYFRTIEVEEYSPKYYLEMSSLAYFKERKGVNFLARDGYLYATKVVEVNAKSMKERKS